jgi:hypothetical protein
MHQGTRSSANAHGRQHVNESAGNECVCLDYQEPHRIQHAHGGPRNDCGGGVFEWLLRKKRSMNEYSQRWRVRIL